MATKPMTGKPIRQTTITGNRNSGIIAGGDIHGDIRMGQMPPPPEEDEAAALPGAASEAAPIQPLRILFLGASPRGVQPLRLDVEVREIDLAMRQAEFRERFDLRQQHAVRAADLQAALLRYRPQIVHFSGHGSPDGICLEDDSGNVRKVQGEVIARILGVFKKQIRCVVLNACYSRDQAEAIAKDIGSVIGMSTAIADRASIRFSASFYQALAFGSSIEEAFQLACAQVALAGSNEGSTPQLFSFLRDPGEIFFVQDGR